MSNINLDAVRNLQGNGALALVQEQNGNGTLRAAGIGHRLAVFFNIGNARAANRQLLDDFKTALRNDPRYFNLDEKISELVGQIRTDRTVHADAIRNVVTELDRLSSKNAQLNAIYERATAHVAMRGVPDCCKNAESAYTRLAGKFVQNFALQQANKPTDKVPIGLTDIAARLDDFDEEMTDVMAACGEDEDLKAIVNKNLYTMLARSDGSVRNVSDAITQVQNYASALAEARSFAAQGIGSYDVCREFLMNSLKGPTPGTIAKILTAAHEVRFDELETLALKGKEDVPALHAALLKLSAALTECSRQVALDDPDAAANVGAIFVRAAVENLSREMREKLLAFLASNGVGRHLRAAYQNMTDVAQIATLGSTVTHFIEEIGMSLGHTRDDMALEAQAANVTGVPASAAEVGLAPETLAKFAPEMLSEEERPQAERVNYPENHQFSPAQAQVYRNLSALMASQGKTDAEIVATFNDFASDECGLLDHAALCATPEKCTQALETVHAVRAALVDDGGKPLSPGISAYVEMFILEDLEAMPEDLRPAGEALKKYLAECPFLRHAKQGPDGELPLFTQGEVVARLMQMPPEPRRAFLATLEAFDNSTDIALMVRFSHHDEALTDLYREGRLTRATAYAAITGNPDVPAELAPDKSGASVRGFFSQEVTSERLVKQIKAAGANAQLLVGPVMILMLENGLDADTAIQVATGKRPLAAVRDKYASPVMPSPGRTAQELEGDLSKDVNRFTVHYKIGDRELPQTGGAFLFTMPDGESIAVSTNWDDVESSYPKAEFEKFKAGEPSVITSTLVDGVRSLCGAHNELQMRYVMMALGQGSMAPIHDLAALHGFSGNEHSPAVWVLSRSKDGSVHISVSEPEDCEIKFHWAYSVAPNGKITLVDPPVIQVPPAVAPAN